MQTKSFFKTIFVVCTAVMIVSLQGCSKQQQASEEPMQTLPMHRVSLADLETFQPVEENWMIAGGIRSNRTVEHDLHALEGTGILVNKPTGGHQDHLFTRWKHGDLELELDVLMPKGSNSGIYLMGRYEVQLLDSWGVEDPQFSDAGGIYQRWDESRPEGQKGFEGSAPRMNAARAPGLWQHYKILFKAPEFNEEGEKISNAKFKKVWLNDALVQENVELSGPTRAAAFQDEQAEGPLMIQGDHGPVAIRNITYKRYDKKHIALNDLTYKYYPGVFEQFPDFDSLKATETGSADSLSGNIVSRDDRYALRFTGTIETPNTGTYLFKLRNAGMVRMFIDGNAVFDHEEVHRMHELESNTLELEGGTHDFTLEYIDHPNNWYSGLSLEAEGPRLRLQNLHGSSSVPGGGRELPDLIVEAKDRVKAIRSFAMHKGSKRTHVLNVGAPKGISFSYDMGQAALLHAWNGPFINTNQMWINRGQPQIADPVGPTITFDGKPLTARLSSATAAWPDSISWDQLRVEGYTISEAGWPVFRYSLAGVGIEDRFEGYAENRRLVRTIHFEANEVQDDLWFQLASGKEITRNEMGEYVVDDRTFYLDLIDTGGQEPQIIETRDGYDLRMAPLNESTAATLTYAIIW